MVSGIGERLAACRKANGWTLQQVADNIGVVASSVCHYERGSITPSLEIFIKLANLYGCTADYLIRGVPEDMPAYLREEKD